MFAILSSAGQFAGTALSAYGLWSGGDQAEENADAEAARLELLADEERAMRSIESGEERTNAVRKRASMEARYAKSGLAISGSPLYLMKEQSETDEFNIISKDRASNVAADDLDYRGSLLRYQGQQEKRAARIGTFGSVLGSVSSAGGQVADYDLNIGARNTANPSTGRRAAFLPENNAYGSYRPQMNTINSIGKNNQFVLNNGAL